MEKKYSGGSSTEGECWKHLFPAFVNVQTLFPAIRRQEMANRMTKVRMTRTSGILPSAPQ